MMNSLSILSPTPASGKTVISVGIITGLLSAGIKVLPFKPITESNKLIQHKGINSSISFLHLCSAANLSQPFKELNPVVMIPESKNIARIHIFGETFGKAKRLGRDTFAFDTLTYSQFKELKDTIFESYELVKSESEFVIAEGCGSVNELSILGLEDLANVVLTENSDFGVLVGRVGKGGVYSTISGTLANLHTKVRQKLKGVIFNDVRHFHEQLNIQAVQLCKEFGLSFLGIIPWIDFFENRQQNAPFTPGSQIDHLKLGELFCEYVGTEKLLALSTTDMK